MGDEALPPRVRSLVLASASPRRLDLLRRVGLEPAVRPADVDESVRPDEDPFTYVARLSVEKAHRQRRDPGDLVIAADTAVVIDGRVLGKAEDAHSVRAMLTQLAGRTHTVATGVAVIGGDGRLQTRTVTTSVQMTPLSDADLAWYLATGEPYGKAGGYAVQGRGAAFVAAIDGSWTNVMGLPLPETVTMLRAAGLTLPA